MSKWTTILISKETKNEVKKRKLYRETFDEIIVRLITIHDLIESEKDDTAKNYITSNHILGKIKEG